MLGGDGNLGFVVWWGFVGWLWFWGGLGVLWGMRHKKTISTRPPKSEDGRNRVSPPTQYSYFILRPRLGVVVFATLILVCGLQGFRLVASSGRGTGRQGSGQFVYSWRLGLNRALWR